MLNITFYMQIPVSLSKVKREALIGQHHVKRPDIENLAKGIMDSLSGVVYDDDSQVCELILTKRYSETPQTILTLHEID